MTVSRAALAAAIGTIVAGVLLVAGMAAMVALVIEVVAPPTASGHHDFLAFWSAGRLIVDGRPAELYDASALTALQRTVISTPIGMNGYMPFINPPFAAALIAPFASLAEPVARGAWLLVNVGLAVAAGLWITRAMAPRERLLGAALIVTSYPVYHALAEGQWSIVLLVAGLTALAAARRNRRLASGVALGVMWLKPQFIALPLLALIAAGRFRQVVAAVAVGIGLLALALPFTGMVPNLTYAGYLFDVVLSHFTGAGASGAAVWRGDLASTEGINGLLVGWFGQDAGGLVNVGWVILVGILGALYLSAARAAAPGLDTPRARAMLAAGIALVMLVNPNQFVQDCVLLYLALDALGPLPASRRLWITVLFVAIADLTFLDLQVRQLHAFPIVLVVGVVLACRPNLVPSSLIARRVPPAASETA